MKAGGRSVSVKTRSGAGIEQPVGVFLVSRALMFFLFQKNLSFIRTNCRREEYFQENSCNLDFRRRIIYNTSCLSTRPSLMDD
jgi:hypothetical protein